MTMVLVFCDLFLGFWHFCTHKILRFHLHLVISIEKKHFVQQIRLQLWPLSVCQTSSYPYILH